jgi:hypothetical protein
MEYPADPKWANYFFRTHSFAELKEWTLSMRYFRFCRAIGGFANDPDLLVCALRIDSEDALIAVTSRLNISLRALPADAPAPRLGQAYTPEESRQFRTRITAFPRFEQPGRVELAGVDCYVWVNPGNLEFQLYGAADHPYEIDVHDVENARKIEELLVPFSDLVIDPPREGKHCFTRSINL